VDRRPFYVPLAVLGVPVEIYLGCRSIDLLYQFWIHTRLVGRLGPLEWVMNTPSHHRVHHGINRRYIDRNYAGIFIIWDRMFGTFEPESEPVMYGAIEPLRSWNPVWAQLAGWARLIRRTRELSGFDRVKLWFAPPEWSPSPKPWPSDAELAARPRYDPDHAPSHAWLIVQMGPVALALGGMLLFAGQLPAVTLAVGAAWCLATLLVFSGILEGRTWARPLDDARLLGGVGVGALVHPGLAIGAAVWAAASRWRRR
jgi:hypothetical protein